MIFNPLSEYVWTEDNIRLQGMHYWVDKKDVCVLMVHGMSGVFIDNVFGEVLGRRCAEAGYGYIYTHNRGWGIMNDLTIGEKNKDGGFKSSRNGAVYEMFEDCLYDIDAWVNKATEAGYKRIVLVGHSYGGPKVIYYQSKKQNQQVVGVVLASAADMVGTSKMEEEDYESIVKEAELNITEGNPDKLLKKLVGGWARLSSQTFLDESVDGGPADVLLLLRNPECYPELASIKLPILALMSEHDLVSVYSSQKDLDLIEEKAVNSKVFSKHVIAGTDHVYEGKEEEFSKVIVEWVERVVD